MGCFLKYDSFFLLIGCLWLLCVILKVVYRLYRLFQFKRYDLSKRYGQGTFVVITGASDGIGKGLCFAFAKRGFNLILISRTKSKLEKVESELKAAYSGIQTFSFTADFSQAYKPGFFDDIFQKVKHLDVSILVNNAGQMITAEFTDTADKENIDMVVCNTIPVVTLTHKFLPQMLKREKKSAVINMSSIQGVIPFPYTTLYSATKAHVDFFTNALRHEYKNIDFLNARPGYVSTEMTHNKSKSFDTLTVEECTEGILRDLGHMENSYGHWRHQAQNYFLEILPRWIIYIFYTKIDVPKMLEARKKANISSEKKNN